MAKVTLTVTVFNGTPPFTIEGKLYKNGAEEETFSYPSSFTHPFDLGPGEYRISTGGSNPAGGQTKLEITKEDILFEPPDNSPITKRGKKYNVDFNFKVQ